MKIGIITFWDSQDNYGQILQCYALSKYLSNEGHDAIIIRYLPSCRRKKIERLKRLTPAHAISYLKYRHQCKTLSNPVGVVRNFDSFKAAHIEFTDKVYHGFEELWHENWTTYDAFVCGSDQIWSPKPDEQLNAYFLQFAPFRCLRVAYAPSFGRSVLPEEYQSRLYGLLKHFDSVSVREKEGVTFCDKAGIDCKLVCDPTILLGYLDYKNLIQAGVRERKVFCYMIKWDTLFPVAEVKKYVEDEFNGTHYFCTNGQERIFKYEKDQTIINWLSSIQSSSLSLTNSFHGIVFSILFHTPFVVFPLKGEAASMNNRLVSLLYRLGLENRIYTEDRTVKEIAEAPIDWGNVDKMLDEFRFSSETFLKEALTLKKDRQCKHNVCFLTRASVHHNYGGLDRVTELLAEYLKKQGANVYFVSQCKRNVVHEDLQHFLPDDSCFHSAKNAEWLNTFLTEKNVGILINQEGNVDLTLPVKEDVKRITVLHFNPNYIDDSHFEVKFKKNKLLRCIFRSYIGVWGLRYLRNKLSRNYEHQVQWSDSFVMLSDLFRQVLSTLMPNGYDYRKVIAINNPIVLEEQFNVADTHKEKTVLYVGRIDNGFKNVDKLIRIWDSIADSVPDWNFQICGQGGEYELNKEYIRKNGIPRCYMMGLVNPVEYYKKSQIIVMASAASEGWGMVLVEAQRYGCVPIALNSYASVRDIIKDGFNGYIVDPSVNMEKQFAGKLLALMQNDVVRQRMMYDSIETVKRYDINIIGQLWLKLINE